MSPPRKERAFFLPHEGQDKIVMGSGTSDTIKHNEGSIKRTDPLILRNPFC